jgi:hypothetical protein
MKKAITFVAILFVLLGFSKARAEVIWDSWNDTFRYAVEPNGGSFLEYDPFYYNDSNNATSVITNMQGAGGSIDDTAHGNLTELREAVEMEGMAQGDRPEGGAVVQASAEVRLNGFQSDQGIIGSQQVVSFMKRWFSVDSAGQYDIDTLMNGELDFDTFGDPASAYHAYYSLSGSASLEAFSGTWGNMTALPEYTQSFEFDENTRDAHVLVELLPSTITGEDIHYVLSVRVELSAHVQNLTSYPDPIYVTGDLNGTFQLGTTTAPFEVRANVAPQNDPPVADAGPDQWVAENASITLAGSGNDPDGDTISYSWTQVEGTHVTLSGSNSASPTFTAPTGLGSSGEALVFQLKVADEGGLTATDRAIVDVSNVNQPPVANAGDDQEVTEGDLVTLNGSGDDPDGEISHYWWRQTAGTEVILSDPDIASPTFAAPEVGSEGETLTFELEVTDNGGLRWSDRVMVNVSNMNWPPVANAGDDQTVNEGDLVTLNGSAHDPDGDSVSYWWSQPLGPEVTLSDPESPSPTFTAPSVGSEGEILTFRLYVSDSHGGAGLDYVNVYVSDVSGNHEPQLASIGNRSVNESELLEFPVLATDLDGDVLTLSTSILPPGASFTDNGDGTGLFSWTPDYGTDGNYPVTFTVTDNGNPQFQDSETIIISVGNVNRPPELSPVGNRSTVEGTLLQFSVTATDPDGDPLALSTSTLPPGASFTDNGDGTGQFSWTPDLGTVGSYTVTFTVTDDGNPQYDDSETITITVSVIDTNLPPYLSPIGSQSVNEDELLQFSVTATDPNGDTLTLATTILPPGASFTDNGDGTGLFSWTPHFEDAGNYGITFAALDNGSPPLHVMETILIAVVDVNRPPELGSIGSQSVNEGELLEFSVTATDLDGDNTLALSTSLLPPGASFTDNGDGTGQFSWTPDFGEEGNYPVTFTVADNGNPPYEDFETINISVTNVNRPPQLDPVGDRSVGEGELLEFSITATDPDGDTLTLSTSTPPPGASFADNGDGTGQFSWNPDFGEDGNYPVTFTVTDNGNPPYDDSETITIYVGDVNQPPQANAGDDQTRAEGDLVTLDGSGSYDPDLGDTITYEWQQIGQGPIVALSDPTAEQPTFTAPNVGPDGETLIFQLTVTDDGDPQRQQTDTCDVIVTGENEAPVANAGGNQTVDEDETVILNGSNSFDPDYGDVLTYQWTQTGGDHVDLTDADKAEASFTAPNVGPNGLSLTFELTVTDEYGDASSTDECIVTVTWENQRPTAEAGDTQTVNEGETVTLDGLASDDPDIPYGDSITHAWQQTDGPDVGTLTDADQAQASFVAPNVGPNGAVLTFELTVNDSGGLFHKDECFVNVGFVNEMPEANAGDDQTVDEGVTVTLDGSGSDDPDIPEGDSINYLWEQKAGGPPIVTLSDLRAQQPTFIAGPVDESGAALTFELTVTDGDGQTNTDTVDIVIEDNGIEGFPSDCITTTCSTGDPVGLRCGSGGHLVAVDTSVDPDTLPDEGKPEDLMYGVIGTQIKCNPGETVALAMIFQAQVPDDYTVFKYGYRFDETIQQYEANESWYDYSSDVTFNQDRTQVTLTLTDGGAGDHNRAGDGMIVDPASIGAAPAVQPQDPVAPTGDTGGGGGCFIETAVSGSIPCGHCCSNVFLILSLLVAVAACTAMARLRVR